jgi:murein DD-endopeptidase MepM/ murein hydrolase activator NlpD
MLVSLVRRPQAPLRRYKRHALGVVAVAAVMWTVAGASPGDLPALDVQPKSVRQGDCAFVIVRPGAAAPSAGECRWRGKTFSLFEGNGGYRAIVPISPDARAGPQTITVLLRNNTDAVTQTSLSLLVVKRAFGVQKLRMKKETTRLYSDPSVEQEGKTIHAALTKVSSDQLWQGPFVWPCKGRVSTNFGMARSINGRIQYRHKGLDIAAAMGTPVVAANAGVVMLVRPDYRLHGKTIVIDHGQGVGSLYLHLSEILVSEGQRVAQGDLIGRVGATGAATGPHLHWGMYVGGEAVEPQFWISGLPAAGK